MMSIRQNSPRRGALALLATLLAVALLLLWLPLERPTPTRAESDYLLDESFTGITLSTPWTFGTSGASAAACLTAGGPLGCGAATGGGLTGTLPDMPGGGALRLTNNSGNQAGFALSHTVIPSGNGIAVSFDYYAYGGTGADGLTFFLIDGASNPTQGGSFGGSLGYAQRLTPPSQPGIVGGYIGIGIDEFGNYSNASEGRGTGCTTNYGTPGSAGLIATGAAPDRVTVRGARNTSDATGLSGYCYLASGPVGSSLDNPAPGVTNRTGATRHTIQLTLSPQNVLSVEVDGTMIVIGMDLDSVAGQPAFPASFKVGFAGSTGGSTNYHEVQNLLVQPLGSDLSVTVTHTDKFTAGQPGTYILQVANSSVGGVVEASDGLTVIDTLPTEASFVSAAGTSWNCSAARQIVTCDYTDLPVGSGEMLPPIVLTVRASGEVLHLINTTTVRTARDFNLANNTDNDLTNVIPVADFAVVNTLVGNVVAGQPITYSITLTNKGPSTVSAPVHSIVPTAIGGVIWSCLQPIHCDLTGNTINTNVLLDPGEVATISFSGVLRAGATGRLTTTVWVGVSSGALDPDTSNNISDVTIVATQTSFNVKRTGRHALLTWTTDVELDTLGFRLYRSSTVRRDDAQEITGVLIPAGGQDGTSYSWIDTSAQAETDYHYWLAEVMSTDTVTEHGPVLLSSSRLYLPNILR